MRHKFALLAVCFTLAAAMSQSLFATNATVGYCAGPGTHYPNIQAAVNALEALAGTRTVDVCPGIYTEQVTITKSLTLQGIVGSGQNNAVIASPAGGVAVNTSDLANAQPTAAQILVAPSSPTTAITVNISDLAVDGSNNGLGPISACNTDLVGIYYQNASGTINHVATRFQELPTAYFGCQDGLAIYVQSGYGTGGTATVTVENSSVHDYDKNGITADGSGTNATITGNYVVGIGATTLIAQNGIQLSVGAIGKISSNTVTDDVYINPSNCLVTIPWNGINPECYSASGILLYDSGGTSATPVTVSSNTVSNTQGAIVTYTDGAETADYNSVTTNKVTTVPAIVGAETYTLDGIDLCSDNNTATSNTVLNASGAGVHLDSSCTEPSSLPSGTGSAATNVVNEACAGVLTGSNGGTQTGTVANNVVAVTASGDSCPSGEDVARRSGRPKVRPFHHER